MFLFAVLNLLVVGIWSLCYYNSSRKWNMLSSLATFFISFSNMKLKLHFVQYKCGFICFLFLLNIPITCESRDLSRLQNLAILMQLGNREQMSIPEPILSLFLLVSSTVHLQRWTLKFCKMPHLVKATSLEEVNGRWYKYRLLSLPNLTRWGARQLHQAVLVRVNVKEELGRHKRQGKGMWSEGNV